MAISMPWVFLVQAIARDGGSDRIVNRTNSLVHSQHVLKAREYAVNAVWHEILAGPVEVGLGRRTACDEHRSWGLL